METDSEELLHAGISVARNTWDNFSASSSLKPSDPELIITHQVGKAHTNALFSALGLDSALNFSSFETLGNCGASSLPTTYAMACKKPIFNYGKNGPHGNWKRTFIDYALLKSSIVLSFPEQYSFSQNYFITHSGHRMHYLDEGSSNQESIVFLHGNPTWSFMYRNLISQLSNDYRCIAPDHIGCGLSEKPSLNEFSYDLEGHSANLFDLLEKLEVKHFSLVVHDWGGAIGLTAFRKEYQRVQKVVLLNTASFNSDDVPKRIQFCRIPLLGSLFVRAFNGFAWPASFMASTKGLTKTA